ncbi:MAG TPA: 3-methyl-2-oxobutanoate dehydrogenase subunit VorB [Bacteroidales bacterium]|nr:3-methyl-2-oxobutanoate dehydrogenase subunit VorB [Bacteroidales bacterium]HOG55875.1 3-methyl-2-oxobutanoate dehydrogenase subunit VorB [Bacteroidales bacterium]HPB12929.1 3-methyl-2-oxobutanoate dehydrogenase subunit VorB [Bacteroidales bacterium]
MERELRLMKGNEAVAEAAIRAGVDGYFGYPITPQSEIIEYLMEADPAKTTGMVVVQAESEVAAINMVYGGAGCGKKVMTTSSSPGISLKQEGITYIAGAELPCVIVNVVRGGPGLGTIQPAQSDYFQAVKGGGHGDYHLIVLAPASVQEMADFVGLGFDLAFKYRNPVMILSDGAIGQMMEKVWLDPPRERSKEIPEWATTGKTADRKRNIITSLELDPFRQEVFNRKLVEKYDAIRENEVRFEEYLCEDAEYLLVAYGTSARVCQKAVQLAREQGIKAGLLRPITLFPFPTKRISELAGQLKMALAVEMSAGQMIEDVQLSINGKIPVHYYGRMGGMVPTPDEVVENLKERIIGG